MSVEIILHNAKIATNGVPSFVEAIAISDGKVTAIGGNEEILRLRGPATSVIDGRGAPSFLDSMIRICIPSVAGSITTLSCAGMVYPLLPTHCAC